MRQRLGKTWTAFAEYTILRKQGKIDWCFIICPNSIKQQWQDQIELANPYIPIVVYNSQNKKQTEKYFTINKRGGVFIINYESLHSFVEWLAKDPLFDPSRVYLVADESTKIKQPSAQMTKAALKLAEICKYKRVMTGKPTANSNADLWAQLSFIGATTLNAYQFRHYYVRMGGYRGKQVIENINVKALQDHMKPHAYIAPDKYLVGFEKVYEPLRRVKLTDELEQRYKQMENDFVFMLANNVKIQAQIALTQYLRLQQISSGIGGDERGVQHNLIDPFHNPRIRVLKEIVDSEITNKVIIACRFKLSIENIEKVLIAGGYKVAKLIGNMSPSEIEEQKGAFNNGDTHILIGQLQVLAYGHNLAGSKEIPCDSVIFYENDYSLLNRSQCESRPEEAPEEGKRNIPISYYDFYSSKMDRAIIQALIKKEDAAMKLMGYARQHGLRIGENKEDEC